MTGYRDTTEALKARNASLEAELAASREEVERLKGRATPVLRTPRNGVLAAGVMVPVLVAGSAFVMLATHREATEANARLPVSAPSASSSLPSIPLHDPARLRWAGAKPVLVDLNGDQRADVVGRVISYDDQMAHAAAFDGKTGRELWETPPLGTPTEVRDGKVWVSPDALLFESDRRDLSAFDMIDGAPLSHAALESPIVEMCHARGRIELLLESRRSVAFRPVDGAVSPSASSDTCSGVPSDTVPLSAALAPKTDRETREDGIEALARVEGPSSMTVVMGYRVDEPIGAVAAHFSNGHNHWRTDIGPHVREQERMMAGLAATARGIYTSYRFGENEWHLVALDLDGKLRWNVVVPGPGVERIDADMDGVFVTEAEALRVYDPATGALRFQVGPPAASW